MHIRVHRFVLITGVCLIILMTVCCSAGETQKEVSPEVQGSALTQEKETHSGTAWAKISLTDAVTGEQYTINDIAKQGKPVILHTFAVWCSACLIQLKETQNLVAEHPDEFAVIGVDVDPNENQDLIKRHIKKYGFPGRYSVSPHDVSIGMIGSFGNSFFTNLPQTVIICNHSIIQMGTDGGVFRKNVLEDALSQTCG